MTARQQAEKTLQSMTKSLVEKLTPILFAPVSMQQMATANDVPAKGPIWVSRTTFNKPDDRGELASTLHEAFVELAPSKGSVPECSIADVPVQWTAFRPSGQDKEPETTISEQEKFYGMIKDVRSDTVILYAHGGFYYSGSPASVRPITLALARATGGRCVVPEYRLSPQNPFPAALIDLFITYLSLLYPSESALHTPVSAKNIVFAGDSSGGNLVLSLLALLQHIRDHHNGCVNFRGKRVDLPLPAGVATMSAHCDHTLSFDSQRRNKPYDIFVLDLLPCLQPSYPSCDLWPTNPPREDIYCDASTLLHPLVSVAIAPSWSSRNMPPIFMATGQDCLVDAQFYLAKKAEKAGTKVQFLHYDALPHIFPSFFPKLPQSKDLMNRWGAFCRNVVVDPGAVESEWTAYAADDVELKGARLDLQVDLDEEERKRNMREKVAERKPWTGTTETAML